MTTENLGELYYKAVQLT